MLIMHGGTEGEITSPDRSSRAAGLIDSLIGSVLMENLMEKGGRRRRTWRFERQPLSAPQIHPDFQHLPNKLSACHRPFSEICVCVRCLRVAHRAWACAYGVSGWRGLRF